MTTAPARTHNRQATCSAILAATAAIITEKGLDNFTISEIGRRADVNRALIYHYYQNRENLITHAVDWIMERNNIPASKLSGDAVAETARMYIQHPEIGRVVFQLLLSGRPLLRLGVRLKENLAHVEELPLQPFPLAREALPLRLAVERVRAQQRRHHRVPAQAPRRIDHVGEDGRLRLHTRVGLSEWRRGPACR